MHLSAAARRLFYWGSMVKVIDIPDENEFELFCEKYDIPVMDRSELFDIFEQSGRGYALREWRKMQRECMS